MYLFTYFNTRQRKYKDKKFTNKNHNEKQWQTHGTCPHRVYKVQVYRGQKHQRIVTINTKIINW